jgi:hypothetical protein
MVGEGNVKVSMREAIGGRIYQAKITLKGIRPPIWRRVLIPGAMRLSDLHQVIQTVFGWTDSHLHQFVIDRASYGRPDDFDAAVLDETGVTLAGAVGNRIKRFASSMISATTGSTRLSLRRSSAGILVGNARCVWRVAGTGRQRTAEARRGMRSFFARLVIPATRNTKRCLSGWAAILIRRRLILRR